MLECKHYFHTECIIPWFKNNHACPTCRFDLNLNMPAAEAEQHEPGSDEIDQNNDEYYDYQDFN
jgi:hypothetical protein